jgi:biotin carboxyl carrier protein
VTLDGREVSASVAQSGGRWSLLVAAPEPVAAGRQARGAGTTAAVARSYDVSIETGASGTRIVRVNGTAVPVSVVDPRTSRGRMSPGDVSRGRVGGAGSGPATVLAPMAGRIVRVLVQPGDEVRARQALVVIEAMKMENELRAPRSGTVGDIRVSEGASIEANTVLLVLQERPLPLLT